MSIATESRAALRELIDTLEEIDARWAGEEWNLFSPDDVVGAHRNLMHLLEGGLVGHFEYDPLNPQFRRIVTPSRKFTGDNADALYFDAPVTDAGQYRVVGEMDGAVYVSITIEAGTESGSMGTGTAGVINSEMFDVNDGRFELFLGGEPRDRNWLPLDNASRITVRYYWEEEESVAADLSREPQIVIEPLHEVAPAAPPSDASVAAGMRRVSEFLRARTLGMLPMAQREQPEFVSIVPNEFPPPVKPGAFALAAFDAAYSMAPYYLEDHQALVITGKWPECIFANVVLWNRFQQSYDFVTRQISRNRKQTELQADGGFRMIIAHRDPGLPNWIDTQGTPLGLVFWRFMLPEGEIETPQAEVVDFADIALSTG
ncbi:hypothetical protein A3709_01000 [Halioglobus sp. HI00S01]|uniref:hypothetical protein n=1 Tax=Halioglobus sp. HI00S01 TaxID=1822214 RepID=UPI0007C3AFCA|nr:hypothetical protein [Halioglobus sp. HI00S01]KZX60674.1 hypothetical protein A3709_01000 [Halioglobus sp. HI00S01]